jgi:Flp pilus assembly protein TadD
MLVRLLLFAAVIAPSLAQQAETPDAAVTKYIAEMREKLSPQRIEADRRQILADLTKQLDETSDPARKATLYIGISQIDELLGDSDAAMEAARSARSLRPADATIALRLAQLLLENNKTTDVSDLVGVDPTDGRALIHRAEELVRGRSTAVAVYCAERAHELLPGETDVTDRLGLIYMEEGRVGPAISIFRQAVERDPENSTDRYHLGLAILRGGRKDDARIELQTALQLHPEEAERALIERLLATMDAPLKQE